VVWLRRTQNVDDLVFLDKLLASEPEYTAWNVSMDHVGYANAYDNVEDDVLYVKIDTDIVRAPDSSAPQLEPLHARA
jgi:hypothetical protein